MRQIVSLRKNKKILCMALMPHCCRNVLFCLIVLSPFTAGAMSRLYEAEAVVTLRNGNPCFSSPPADEKLFGFDLSVARIGQPGTVAWAIWIFDYETKNLPEPTSPENCIEYGVADPAVTVKQPAAPLAFDTPYRVLINIAEGPVGGHRYRFLRKLGSEFCIGSNDKGEMTLAGAGWDSKANAWRCRNAEASP